MEKNLNLGDIKFYDNYLPSIKSGKYTIKLKQDIRSIGISLDDKNNMQSSQEFVVQSPRFILEQSDIYSKIPPSNSVGNFKDELPHIVLNKRILPWERNMKGKSIPWLALMVFQENELKEGEVDFTHHDTKAIQTTVKKYRSLENRADLFIPKLTFEEEEMDINQTCFYIKVSSEDLKKIVPYEKELPFLTHVRQIDTGDKAIIDTKDSGWFSVVIANRFPFCGDNNGMGTKNIVHLVSLEGMDDYLKDGANLPNKDICLLSLASWTFHCISNAKENNEDFGALIQNLISQYGTAYSSDKLLLRLFDDNTDYGCDSVGEEIKKRLQQGYAPLQFHTRTGEETLAWYRGPLSPVLTASIEKSKPFLTGDAALIYDRKNGIFDNSLATAWQIGRSLGLLDKGFGKSLLEFRKNIHQSTDYAVNNINLFGISNTEDINHLTQSNLVKKSFLKLLEDGFITKISKLPMDVSNEYDTKTSKKLRSLKNPVKSLHDFMTSDYGQSTLEKATEQHAETIVKWIANKQLLYDIPFDYLVPDSRMLPIESVRFFYIDENWLDAMLDGMLSISIHSSRDSLHYKLTKDTIKDLVKGELNNIRDKLRGKNSNLTYDSIESMSGFLLHSALVSGWPGMSVCAFDSGNNLIKILRMDHLSSNVLIIIFAGIPEVIKINQPQEGIQFGVDYDGKIKLRSILDDMEQSGFSYGEVLKCDLDVRKEHIRNQSILDINPDKEDGLIKCITNKIKEIQNMKETFELSPSEFAMQMIKPVSGIMFNNKD